MKRLQSFGILNVTVESGKIVENVHVQLFVYQDEIEQAYADHEIFKHFETTIKIHTLGQGANEAS